MERGPLAVDSQSLGPLPPNLHQGLIAITSLAFLSFAASTILFFYLGYKLAAWHLFIKYTPRIEEQNSERSGRGLQHAVDFALGIDGIFSEDSKMAQEPDPAAVNEQEERDAKQSRREFRRMNPPNQFLVLVFNLLLADMHQATAFFLNVVWLQHNEIIVGTSACFAQGLFVSLGDLASSCFITFIAIHTYMAVVKGLKMSQNMLYTCIGLVWLFVYAISVIPIAATRSGAKYGGFFVRAGSWCWMNTEYENLRLMTHYLFIFMGIVTTSVLYLLIFFFLRRRASSLDKNAVDDRTKSELQLTRNPAFLIYPVIYVLCTLPLALGRIATMAGAKVPLGYFCFAGAMIASNGTFDCLLFGTTRNVIIFASKYEIDRSDVGLHTFTFMHQSRKNRFGNFVFIQGGRQRTEDKVAGGWWSWQRLAGKPEETRRSKGTRSVSQESLRGPAIQMDTVTSVVVEHELDKERDVRYPDPAASATPSMNGSEGYQTRGF